MTIIKDRPKSAVRTGYGLLNRYGDFWSREVFDSPEKLREHFDEFWRSPGFEGKVPIFEDYKVVKVRQTISYLGPAVPKTLGKTLGAVSSRAYRTGLKSGRPPTRDNYGER